MSMGSSYLGLGNMHNLSGEFNFFFDLEATKIIFEKA